MSSSLSSLVDNLSKGLHNEKCKKFKSYLDYISIEDNKLICKRIDCNKNYSQDLIERFANTYEFCDKDINEFILLLRKGIYPYEYMDDWNKFDETSLPNKKEFYSSLTMEDITDSDYRHVCSKKTGIKLELLTDTDMLLMVEKRIRGGICHSIHRYAKANNKYMKNYDENKESSHIQYLDANNLYGWAMSKILPFNEFKWEKNTSKFNEEFIKNYDEKSDKGYILEEDVEYLKDLHGLHSDLLFLPERMKINKCNKLVWNLYSISILFT